MISSRLKHWNTFKFNCRFKKIKQIIKETLKDITGKVKDTNITKTAMIVVGDVLDPGDFNASKLYDKNFKHEYR